MSYSVESIEPKLVWKYFDEIRKIPHGSRNEEQLGKAIVSWAKAQGCETATDDVGNILIKIKASSGLEDAPAVVLQGHIDMVCEKNSDTEFDFEKDSLVLVRDGDWITADGTTLGADNGIGVAMGLALMEMPDAVHGPVELLFTTDEETGLNGANNLKPGFVTGKMLINLDAEVDGIIYVGCSGGRDCNLSLPITRTDSTPGHTCLDLVLKGLRGGHSGLDVIQNRGNAIRLLARAINAGMGIAKIDLISIDGGDKHNAIPREATASIQLPAGDVDKVKAVFKEQLKGFLSEFASAEPDLDLVVTSAELPASVLTSDSTAKAIRMVIAVPHGLLAMSRDLEGLPDTSTNMARVRTEDDALTMLTASRSANRSAINAVIERLTAIGELAGATVKASEGYPGWQPNMKSDLLAFTRKTWAEKYGEEPELTAIHAGLECGIIGEKYPGMEMISFGPTIENPHSPDERVSIPTVARIFEFTLTLLSAIARSK